MIRTSLGLLTLMASAEAIFTATPARQDFGKTTVPNGVSPGGFTVSGLRPGDAMQFSITGVQASAGCRMEVVLCNYAHLYSGTFGWTIGLSASGSQEREQVEVNVVSGRAACQGTASSSENGVTRTGRISGPGLIAVEFERDANRPVYRIIVACPTPDWPAGPNAEPATPSRPAELGHGEQESYKQPATVPGMTLTGSYSNPAPETDALNGVTGTVTVSWHLCDPAKYRPFVRPGPRPDSTGRKCT